MSSVFGRFFSGNKTEHTDFSALGADMHAHIIPGIDDGSQDVATSIAMIKGLQELGFSKFISTPHIMPGVFNNDEESIRAATELLNQSAPKETGTTVQYAAEYYIDDDFPQMVNSGKPLLTFGDQYVLVEANMMSRTRNLEEALFELRLRGLRPILAHVERYPYMYEHHRLDQYEKLRDADVLLQVNLRSFTGNYGEIQKRIARHLADAGMISFLGTDLHNPAQLAIIRESMLDQHVQNLLKSGDLLNNTL